MLDLIMSAVIGLSDHTLLQWQTGKPYGYYCDLSVGAQSKHLEIGANSELWSVVEGREGVPVYANYGLYAQYTIGPVTARIEHNCTHHVESGKFEQNAYMRLSKIPAYYQCAETRVTMGIKLKQKVW